MYGVLETGFFGCFFPEQKYIGGVDKHLFKFFTLSEWNSWLHYGSSVAIWYTAHQWKFLTLGSRSATDVLLLLVLVCKLIPCRLLKFEIQWLEPLKSTSGWRSYACI